MSYSIEPAYLVRNELVRLLMKAGTDPVNQWFFTDNAFVAEQMIEFQPNTWKNEDFVVIFEKKIIAYFSTQWSRPLQIITGFRVIFLNKAKSMECIKALFDYFDYIFISRGCLVLNWLVATKNFHACRIYEHFVKKYFGHIAGHRTRGQLSYTGEVSDVILYEATREEYIVWKTNKK